MVSEMRQVVADLFKPNPWLYYIDIILSAAVGWTAFGVGLSLTPFSFVHLLAVLVAALALYRAILFTHELVHLKTGDVPGLRILWSVLVGIPLMVPNFLYLGVHVAHHTKKLYGTKGDGEYLPFATRRPTLILRHFVLYLVRPLAVLLRFALVAPISVVTKQARRRVMQKMSSQSMRASFKREIPTRAGELRSWSVQESGAFVLALGVILATLLGFLPWAVLGHWYLVVFVVFLLNGFRSLGATHRYRADNKESTFEQQLEDSVTVTGNVPSSLFVCPVGLRYHALHHVFPSIPYHQLGKAHKRLWKELPPDAPYRQTGVTTVWAGCVQVWREAVAFSRAGTAS